MEASHKGHVLVIDDDRGPRESLRFTLGNEYLVLCASNVQDGLDIFQSHRVDLVLMDIRMPGMDGIQGLQAIRQQDELVSVVLLTGYASWETAADAVRLGANEYLTKPYDVPKLKEVVRRHVLATRARRERASTLSELGRLNHDLQEQLLAKQGLAALGQNASEMLHDISNPLTVAYGYTELLMEKLQSTPEDLSPEKLQDYLERAHTELHQCKELADLWRAVGREQRDSGQVPMAQLLREVVDGVEALAREQDVTISLTINGKEPDPLVAGSRAQLKRVFYNILVNAIQAVGSESGKVDVSLEGTAENVHVLVEDNGCGITDADQKSIFTPYFSTKHEGGTGLGLYIVQKIVDAHAGLINVESTVGKGTLFHVWLPRQVD